MALLKMNNALNVKQVLERRNENKDQVMNEFYHADTEFVQNVLLKP